MKRWMLDHIRTPKDAGYAQRVLDRYRLGMRARGAIRGVRVIPGADSCAVGQSCAGRAYLPDEAPLIPLAGCTLPGGCRCSYAPVMTYQGEAGAAVAAPAEAE